MNGNHSPAKGDVAPKEKLLQTAAQLFYQHGYRAVGVDTIAAESGIGKMTLYRHYPSKDDLIAAYLRQSDALFWRQWEQITAGIESPREQLLAFFRALQEYALTPACHGCPFLNVATEYPQPEYAGHQVALEHKRAVRARFAQLAHVAGAQEPQALADALLLLMDGAYMAARMFDDHGGQAGAEAARSPARHLAEAAGRLLDAYCSPGPSD